jgi:hypothetical protein
VAPVHRKVQASTTAAAVAGVITWFLGRYILHGHVDPVVQAEIYAACPAVLAFVAGWLTPSKPAPLGVVHREQLPSLPDPRVVTLTLNDSITEEQAAAFKAALGEATAPSGTILPEPPGAPQEMLAPPEGGTS